MGPRPLGGAATAVLLLSLFASPLVALVPAGLADHGQPSDPYPRPIQPGGHHDSVATGWCTFNFVFEDRSSGQLYIGAAAHCTGGPGWRVAIPDHGEVGTVVHRDLNFDGAAALGIGNTATEHYRDFSLIAIDDDKVGLVDPSLRHWGGPTGVQDLFVPGTPLLHYGNGADITGPWFTRPRTGHLTLVYEETGSPTNGPGHTGWYLGNAPTVGGDSGSAVITADGKALGIVSSLAATFGEPGYLAGPTMELILTDLADAGFDLAVVTAPYHVTDPTLLADVLAREAVNCVDQPRGPYSGQACLRDPNPWPQRLTDVQALEQTSHGQGHPTHPDFRDERVYRASNGVAIATADGTVGASTGKLNAPLPFSFDEDLDSLTIRSIDDVSDHVYLAVCVEVGDDGLQCSDKTDSDVVVRGFDTVTLSDLPAGTYVSVVPYGTYVGTDGEVAFATNGRLLLEGTYA